MRILYLTHQYFPRHVGGTEIYLHGLARRARTRGDDVLIITYHESPSGRVSDYGPRIAEHEGIPLIEMHYNLSLAPDPARCEYDHPAIGRAVAEATERFAPDVVHAVHAMKLSAAALDGARTTGAPLIVTLADFWFLCLRHTLLTWDGRVCGGPPGELGCLRCLRHTHGFARGASERLSEADELSWISGQLSTGLDDRTPFWRDVRALRGRWPHLREALLRARRIIALSRFQRDAFIANGFPAERIEFVDHGLETEGLDVPRNATSGPVRIAFIGSLVTHKGAHVLLEALRRAPDLDLELRVWGEVREGDAYGESVRAAAATDRRVRMMGTFSPEKQGEVLAGADALAVPSLWYENNPLVVKAALRARVPVIASAIGCLPEWVREGENGWIAPPGDVGAWTSALRRACAGARSMTVPPSSVKSMDENAAEMFRIYAEEAHAAHGPSR